MKALDVQALFRVLLPSRLAAFDQVISGFLVFPCTHLPPLLIYNQILSPATAVFPRAVERPGFSAALQHVRGLKHDLDAKTSISLFSRAALWTRPVSALALKRPCQLERSYLSAHCSLFGTCETFTLRINEAFLEGEAAKCESS